MKQILPHLFSSNASLNHTKIAAALSQLRFPCDRLSISSPSHTSRPSPYSTLNRIINTMGQKKKKKMIVQLQLLSANLSGAAYLLVPVLCPTCIPSRSNHPQYFAIPAAVMSSELRVPVSGLRSKWLYRLLAFLPVFLPGNKYAAG